MSFKDKVYRTCFCAVTKISFQALIHALHSHLCFERRESTQACIKPYIRDKVFKLELYNMQKKTTEICVKILVEMVIFAFHFYRKIKNDDDVVFAGVGTTKPACSHMPGM